MEFEFVIPLISSDDLLHPSGTNYVVNDIYTPVELPNRLKSSQVSFKDEGSIFVLKHFDTFFSVIKQFSKLDVGIREQSWDIIFSAVAQHGSELCLHLDDSNELDNFTKSKNLNVLKMLSYLLCQMTVLFEQDATKPSADVIVNVGKNKKNKQAKKFDEDSCGWKWDEIRDRCLHCLSQLSMLPLNKLFEPPVVEETFVDLICNCCYKLLENTAISRLRATKDAIFHLLGIYIKKYNHSTGCSLKIIQLLRHFEHLVSPLAYGVGIFVNNFGAKTMINDVMREIGCMKDSDLARDNSETRSYSQFLVEISQNMPISVLPAISLLLPHLDSDAYSMRNCVLEIMGEIVLKVLSDNNIDEKSRHLRNEFLDRLEDHTHDTNAFVRCRVIQIWNKLCTEKVIPLSRQQKVFSLIVGRIEDKSSNVRKYSIQALKRFLESNPFASKLPVEELKQSLEVEMMKLDKLLSSQSSEDDVIENNSPKDAWIDIEKELKVIIEELTPEESSESETSDLPENQLLTDVLSEIKAYLTEKNLKLAVKLLQKAIENWPDYKLFVNSNTDEKKSKTRDSPEENEVVSESESDSDEKQHSEDSSLDIVDILKQIYFNAATSNKVEPNAVDLDCELANVAEKVVKSSSEEKSDGSEQFVVGGIVLDEMNKQKILVQYMEDCVTFAMQVGKALPTVCQLLGSKTNSDVLEAIDFFVTAYEFGVQNTLIGIRKMLLLIWSEEDSIKDAVTNAYRRLYLNPEGNNDRSKALAVVKNLTFLMQDLTLGEMTSLEELIAEFMRSKDLNKHIIQVLWEKFSLKLQNTSNKESSAALQLLSMASSAEVAIIGSNIDVLIEMGFGSRAQEDFSLVRDTCIAFLKLASPLKSDSDKESLRFPETHEMFAKLATILVNGLNRLEDDYWIPMAEQAITMIYKLAEKPDLICSNILKQLASCVSDNLANKPQPEENESENMEASVNSEIMSRVIFFISHVALNQLVHLELNILTELKRRYYIKEKMSENKDRRKSRLSKSRPSLSVNTSRVSKPDGDVMEEEMGLTGAIADDAEAEFLRRICENEIITGDNLLAKTAPTVIHVCSNPSTFKCAKIRAAAALALAKFMLLSSEFCERHLPLLFTILEKSAEPLIRANAIISLGDLSFRFPNLIEPWTPHLYTRLRDESVHVRKNTLLVLTHLTLNDMVKVKGQISDMALCIIDEDRRISGLARLFFYELSQKGNTVYNVLPDIISRLSDFNSGTNEENFKSILEYLFSFIQKDRQVECLVEKLCHRFRATQTERQWRDISFCLSLLTYGEKCVKKLLENFSCFSDKMGDKNVHDSFASILSNAKKTCKVESKISIEELEAKIEEAHIKAVGENQLLEKANILKSKNIKSEPNSTIPISQDVDQSDFDDFQTIKCKKKSIVSSTRKKQHVVFSSDEDEENNPENGNLEFDDKLQTPKVLIKSAETPISISRRSKSLRSSHCKEVPVGASATKSRSTRSKKSKNSNFKTPLNKSLRKKLID